MEAIRKTDTYTLEVKRRETDGNVAASFLKDYKGIVQTDGYAGYNFLDFKEDIIHMGCWVHVRRKFKAVTGLKYISKLYKIEKEAKEQKLSPEQIYDRRQALAEPILDEFKIWLD